MTSSKTHLRSLALRLIFGAAALVLLPSMIGCTKKQPGDAEKDLTGIPGEQFNSSGEPRHVHYIFDTAAASGARADATLHASHFDGGNVTALNSLGEKKLDLMLSDDDALPMVIYLNVAGDEVLAGCERSVRVYLRDRGLNDDQMKFIAGRNPGKMSPTAPKLRDAMNADTKKTETAAPGSAGLTNAK